MASSDARRFVARFERMWRDPQPMAFAELFAEDGTLFHPTMARSIFRTEVPEYVGRLKSLVPDLALRVKNWAASGDVVLIEWVIGGTFGGERVELDGADRFTLRQDRAIEGVAYFDTSALWHRIETGTARGHLLDAAEAHQMPKVTN